MTDKRVTDRSAWRGPEMARDRSWVVELTPTQVRELASGRLAGTSAAAVIDEAREEVLRGRGFVLIRGVPVQGRSLDAVREMYWALGERLGTAIPQNLQGDLVNEIKDHGLDVNQLNVKPSQTSAEQRPHTDPADIVTLLCITPAKRGGLSRIASTTAIYNELLAKHPEYLAWLVRGFHHDLRGDASEAAPYGCTPKPIPVYRWYEGRLSCVFNASTIKDAQRRMGALVPEAEMKAIDTMVELARSDAFRLDMDFRPGDLQILNNYTVMHWRTAFEDEADPAKRRLLLRLWLNAPDARKVDPEMAAGYITGSRVVERAGAAAHG
jgi:hypothetical protein